MSLLIKPRLTWRPDNTQPANTGQVLASSRLVSANLAALSTAPAAITASNGVLDLRPFCPPVDDQYQLSDCVADGTCTALEFTQIRNGLTYVKLSRLFLYYNARLQTQTTNQDDGTYINVAFSTLTSLGTCPEATWAYDATQVFTRPPWAAYQQAYPNKTNAFYGIDPAIVSAGGTALVTAIQQVLSLNCPVVFGMTVDDQFMNTGTDGMVPAYNAANSTDPGGHCTVIVGYNDTEQRYICQNSWGTIWGDNGYYYLLYTDLPARKASDLWVPYLQGSTP